jgi:fucose 4-O-acetylase-like acetyltransferase
MDHAMSPGRERLLAIDHLKVAAIVAVVFTHSGHLTFSGAETEWDFYLTSCWVKFQVPTFLFCSGLLYARSSDASWRGIGSRLVRIGVPYLIASGVAQALGLSRAEDPAGFLFELATASAMGVYYYVFVIVALLPLIWPLARMPRAAIWALWGAIVVYTGAAVVDPGLRMSRSLLWGMRNPFEHFYLGYFLSGWLAALYLPALAEAYERAPKIWAAAAVLGVLYAFSASAGLLVGVGPLPTRILYTFSVIACVTLLTRHRTPGPVVVFLSEATLCLYLYHRIFQRLTETTTWPWPPPLRIAAQVAVGLAAASLLALIGRRLLGPRRARMLLGA